MPFIIRPYEEGDFDAITALCLDSWKSTGLPVAQTETLDYLRQLFSEKLARGSALYVAIAASKVVGFVSLYGDKVEQLFTAPSAQGTGVGRQIASGLDGAQRATDLIKRLLAFARQQPLAPTALDANALVRNMSEILRRTLGGDIELESVLAGGLWPINADRSQVESAIVNLAANARDAMPQGGKLTIETSNAHLDDRYAAQHVDVPPGQYVLVAVTDTGTGMSPEQAAKAFEPFFTTKTDNRGTGLGLAQVYGFAKQSGGHARIYSELGRGTTVKLYLPRSAIPPAASQPKRSETTPLGSARETILVVEDEPRVRQLAAEGLRELGYSVIEADGAEAALSLMGQHPNIVLLFTDVVMPKVDGRKLADEALRRRPGLKVLFTTGFTKNAIIHGGVLDPNTHFVAKPFTLEELAHKVREAIGH